MQLHYGPDYLLINATAVLLVHTAASLLTVAIFSWYILRGSTAWYVDSWFSTIVFKMVQLSCVDVGSFAATFKSVQKALELCVLRYLQIRYIIGTSKVSQNRRMDFLFSFGNAVWFWQLANATREEVEGNYWRMYKKNITKRSFLIFLFLSFSFVRQLLWEGWRKRSANFLKEILSCVPCNLQ